MHPGQLLVCTMTTHRKDYPLPSIYVMIKSTKFCFSIEDLPPVGVDFNKIFRVFLRRIAKDHAQKGNILFLANL